MPRLRGKEGCYTCRHRRKKCDEQKPICGACNRLHLTCSYTDRSVVRTNKVIQITQDQTILPVSPVKQVKNLPTVVFYSGVEESVIHRAPRFLLAFWSIASDKQTRDLTVFLQLILQRDLVRNATVACLSGMLDQGNRYRELYYEAYGRTLIALRAVLDFESMDIATYASLLVSLTFIGFRESTGPDPSSDFFTHWHALLLLLNYTSVEDADKLRETKVLYVWALEGALYHISRIGMFSKHLVSIANMFRYCACYQRLIRANPDPRLRVRRSPLMNGQYLLSKMILDVICLHRTQGPGKVFANQLDELEEELQMYEGGLAEQFLNLPEPTRRALCSEYGISCGSLRICIQALRGDTQDVATRIDNTASKNLARVLSLPLIETNHFGLIWAIQILACALRYHSDFDRLEEYFQLVKQGLDCGHRRRAESLFTRLKTLHAENARVSPVEDGPKPKNIPPGLLLLQQPGGILS